MSFQTPSAQANGGNSSKWVHMRADWCASTFEVEIISAPAAWLCQMNSTYFEELTDHGIPCALQHLSDAVGRQILQEGHTDVLWVSWHHQLPWGSNTGSRWARNGEPPYQFKWARSSLSPDSKRDGLQRRHWRISLQLMWQVDCISLNCLWLYPNECACKICLPSWRRPNRWPMTVFIITPAHISITWCGLRL